MPPVLLTGFEPFGGESINASALAVSAFSGQIIAGRRIETLILPVVFGESSRRLLAALENHNPALVICVGQAAGRAEISVERIAINLEESSAPDNAGLSPAPRPVHPDGPAAYWSTLPVLPIRDTLRAAGLPAGLSLSAGTFVCNHLFYALLHALRDRPSPPAGFIHIPVTPEQAATSLPPPPSLPTRQVIEGLRLAIATSLDSTP